MVVKGEQKYIYILGVALLIIMVILIATYLVGAMYPCLWRVKNGASTSDTYKDRDRVIKIVERTREIMLWRLKTHRLIVKLIEDIDREKERIAENKNYQRH